MPLEVDVEHPLVRPLETADRRSALSLGVVVFAIALPILFLHAAFQPTVGASLASLHPKVRFSDLAVLLVVVAALIAGWRRGFGVLRPGWLVWAGSGAFLVFVFAASIYPLAWDSAYPWKTHLVTAVKYAEYALLAPAVVLLLRRTSERRAVAAVLLAISATATAVAVLQFFGVHILRAWPSGGRQPSFVGVDDFGMLSAGAYAVVLAAVAFGAARRSERRWLWAAGVAGCLGMVLSGALASVLGALLATAVAAFLAARRRMLNRRRLGLLVLMSAAVAVGSVFMRSSALGSFARFLRLGGGTAPSGQVESYSHRWVLDYVGLKIFLRHPVIGAGWQSGYDEQTYGPVLPAAHRRFPSQPALAFPSPAHPWGIQNAYVEALAELGTVGALLFLGWIATGLGVGWRSVGRAPPDATRVAVSAVGVLWLCVAIGVWNGLWFIAGIPFDVLIWLGFGFVAAAAAVRQGT